MKTFLIATAMIIFGYSSTAVASKAATEGPGPNRGVEESVGNAYNCPGTPTYSATEPTVC